jgi:hypothetical protein
VTVVVTNANGMTQTRHAPAGGGLLLLSARSSGIAADKTEKEQRIAARRTMAKQRGELSLFVSILQMPEPRNGVEKDV